MDELIRVVLDTVETWWENKAVLGEQRYITIEGKNYDIFAELKNNKELIVRLFNEKASVEWVLQQLANLENGGDSGGSGGLTEQEVRLIIATSPVILRVDPQDPQPNELYARNI